MPTFKQLQARHADMQMKWFARGRLWASPEEERAAARGAAGRPSCRGADVAARRRARGSARALQDPSRREAPAIRRKAAAGAAGNRRVPPPADDAPDAPKREGPLPTGPRGDRSEPGRIAGGLARDLRAGLRDRRSRGRLQQGRAGQVLPARGARDPLVQVRLEDGRQGFRPRREGHRRLAVCGAISRPTA